MPITRRLSLASCFAVAWLTPSDLTAQRDTAQTTAPTRSRGGAEFRLPVASLIVPGLGQYIYGATAPGLAFTSAAGLGLAIGTAGSSNPLEELPRSASDQLAFEGVHLAFTAGAISAWDTFYRAVPALQREGKYEFLGTSSPSLTSLVTAPFDPAFLGRWTTWVNLAYTGFITGVVLATRDDNVSYEPFRTRDAVFVSTLSFNAAVGEEALFRGWLLPLLHQNIEERFWLANGLQAGIFGAGHLSQAKAFAAVIAGWALFEGWLVRRNDWSIRESIFHHFWYDVFVATATLLADERNVVQLRFPTIRF